MGTRSARRAQPRCPLRPGEPCTLCQLDVTGPEDCGLVYLVMDEPESREAFNEHRRAAAVMSRGSLD
jgi:hypothetical protein